MATRKFNLRKCKEDEVSKRDKVVSLDDYRRRKAPEKKGLHACLLVPPEREYLGEYISEEISGEIIGWEFVPNKE